MNTISMARRSFVSALPIVAAAVALPNTAVAAPPAESARLGAEFNAVLVAYWAEMALAEEAYVSWPESHLAATLPAGYESSPEYQAYLVASERWCDATEAVDRVAEQIMALTPSTTKELLLVAHAWAWTQHSGEDGLSCDVAANYQGGDLRKLVLFLEDIAQREALT